MKLTKDQARNLYEEGKQILIKGKNTEESWLVDNSDGYNFDVIDNAFRYHNCNSSSAKDKVIYSEVK